jgi:hypothetical protein
MEYERTIMNGMNFREQAILEATLKLPPKERAAYLDQACGGDEQLRERIIQAGVDTQRIIESLEAGRQALILIHHFRRPGELPPSGHAIQSAIPGAFEP